MFIIEYRQSIAAHYYVASLHAAIYVLRILQYQRQRSRVCFETYAKTEIVSPKTSVYFVLVRLGLSE